MVSAVTYGDGIDYLRRAVQQRIRTEGLRPFSTRTGIPMGQLRSLVDGRAARSTTLKSVASVLGLQLYLGPARSDSPDQSGLPPEVVQALDLPPNAGLSDVIAAIDKDTMALKLRETIALVQELMERTAAAAALVSDIASHRRRPEGEVTKGAVTLIPFATDVRVAAGTGEVVFDESPELSIAVAAEALPPWARPDRLFSVQAAGDSMAPTILDGDIVAVDPGRTEPLNGRLFAARSDAGVLVKRLRRAEGAWLLSSDNPVHPPRPVAAGDRILGEVAWCGPRGRCTP